MAARPPTAAEAAEAAEKLLDLAEAAAADPRLAAGAAAAWPFVGGEDSLALALRELGARCAAALKGEGVRLDGAVGSSSEVGAFTRHLVPRPEGKVTHFSKEAALIPYAVTG